MTVCVAVRVMDGMVFAADSASSVSHTLAGEQTIISNVYQHGIKVFNLQRPSFESGNQNYVSPVIIKREGEERKKEVALAYLSYSRS